MRPRQWIIVLCTAALLAPCAVAVGPVQESASPQPPGPVSAPGGGAGGPGPEFSLATTARPCFRACCINKETCQETIQPCERFPDSRDGIQRQSSFRPGRAASHPPGR